MPALSPSTIAFLPPFDAARAPRRMPAYAPAAPRPVEPRAALRIDAALTALRDAGRCAIRVLDLGCGDGARLLHTARRASMLGFVAIEGRGVDGDASLIDAARAAAARGADPRIGLSFDLIDVDRALDEEEDRGADIALYRAQAIRALPERNRRRIAAELDRIAGTGVIRIGGAR